LCVTGVLLMGICSLSSDRAPGPSLCLVCCGVVRLRKRPMSKRENAHRLGVWLKFCSHPQPTYVAL
jgi:hypothetical protein